MVLPWHTTMAVASVAKCNPEFPFSIRCLEIQKGVLAHGGGHHARDWKARKSSNLNRLIAVLRNLKIRGSKTGSMSDSVPQWNKTGEFEN